MNTTPDLPPTNTSHHPLEIIPFFARWPRSWTRNLVYTFIWNSLFCAVFTLFFSLTNKAPILEIIEVNFVIAQGIGFSIHFAYALLHRATDFLAMSLPLRSILSIIITFPCVAFGMFMVGQIPRYGFILNWFAQSRFLTSLIIITFLVSAPLTVMIVRREKQIHAEAELAKMKTREAQLMRENAIAELKFLQAQIEPHFLFNTLANVVGLIHPQPDKAKQMLEQFIAYLRATLIATREQHTTLQREFELMQNFLSILQVRMGERLKVRLDLPDDLKNIAIAPMLLQPLVENAIRHGLEPKVEGGTITLLGRALNGQVEISVIDTGLGFRDSGTNGIGLKNVRERLEKLYGETARLTVEENQPGGTRATLTITLTLPT